MLVHRDRRWVKASPRHREKPHASAIRIVRRMQQPPDPAPTPLLERPLARIAIAAVLLVVLAAQPSPSAGRSGTRPTTSDSARHSTQTAGEVADRLVAADHQAARTDFVLRVNGKVEHRRQGRLDQLLGAWCVPKKELPDIQKIYDEKPKGSMSRDQLPEGVDDAQCLLRGGLCCRCPRTTAVYEQYLQGCPTAFQHTATATSPRSVRLPHRGEDARAPGAAGL
jgi:hypothetical protein